MKKYRWRLLTAVILIAGIALIAGGCGGGGGSSSADTVKVGVILPLTGSEAMFGTMEKKY